MPGNAVDARAAFEATGSFVDSESSGSGSVERSERAPAFRAGEMLAGRYSVVRFVSRGGMGEVYEVWDCDLRETVALKTIKPEAAAGGIERLRREVLLARRVTHANVCRIFDLGRHQELNFLTMEFLDGETLAARLLRVGRIPIEQALPIVRQVVAGLGAAHAAGIVHRDFKASNVLLVPGPAGERAVVADFGLARALGPLAPGADAITGTQLVGTPAYMAPEQVQGLATGAAADIYALGVVLFELLTGQRPFRGDSPLATAAQRLTLPVPAPRTLVPNLDPRWDAVVRRCLALRPQDRYGSVHDVLAALAGQRHGRWRRTLVAALLALIAAWLVASVTGGQAPPTPAQAVSAVVPGPPESLPRATPVEARVVEPAELGARGARPLRVVAHPVTRRGPVASPLPLSAPPASLATPREVSPPVVPDPPLAPAPGQLKLLVIPWAEVTVDGRNVGTTPLAPLTIDAGSHVLLFSNPGFAPVSRVVHCGAGETVTVELDLRKP